MSAARLAFAEARVVMRDAYADVRHSLGAPGSPEEIAASIDWDATLAQRARLSRLGFGVGEALDTAQRAALGWVSARRLIAGTAALKLEHGFCAGAGTDHLRAALVVDDLVAGVAHQCAVIAAAGGLPAILPMPLLARNGADEDAYVDVYAGILARVEGPVILIAPGASSPAELAGYLPGRSLERVLELDPSRLRGAKVALDDPEREVALRRAMLGRDQVLLTGDERHFARLLLGGEWSEDVGAAEPAPAVAPAVHGHTELAGREVPLGDFSHALLGALDAVAAPAAEALELLAAGDAPGYLARMLPCEELARHLFARPARHYRAGLAHLAWRAGLQANPMLVNHEEHARDAGHFARAEELARRAGAL